MSAEPLGGLMYIECTDPNGVVSETRCEWFSKPDWLWAQFIASDCKNMVDKVRVVEQ
jgi:hypothetical protein